jgi:hypothetical protein
VRAAGSVQYPGRVAVQIADNGIELQDTYFHRVVIRQSRFGGNTRDPVPSAETGARRPGPFFAEALFSVMKMAW